MRISIGTSSGRWAAGIATALLVGGFAVGAGAQEGAGQKKLHKQIDVLEGIVNEVLVDSQNYLVGSRKPAHGLYLEGYGVVVSFSASLLDKGEKGGIWNFFGGEMKIERDGNRIVIVTPEDDDDDEKGKDGKKKDRESFDLKEWQADREVRQEKLYAAGKQELLDMLRDYGDTITQLRDEETLVIAAFLDENEFLEEEGITRLILRAKMSDLRAHAAGRLADKDLFARIAVEEH